MSKFYCKPGQGAALLSSPSPPSTSHLGIIARIFPFHGFGGERLMFSCERIQWCVDPQVCAWSVVSHPTIALGAGDQRVGKWGDCSRYVSVFDREMSKAHPGLKSPLCTLLMSHQRWDRRRGSSVNTDEHLTMLFIFFSSLLPPTISRSFYLVCCPSFLFTIPFSFSVSNCQLGRKKKSQNSWKIKR